MFSETTFLLVFGLGAICMLLGFVLVFRGIGGAESESSIKLIGVEVRASRVGPGVVFAMFGVVLIALALGKQPSAAGPTPTPTPAPAPQPNPTPAPTPKADLDAPVTLAPIVTPTGGDAVAARRAKEIQLLRQFLAEVATGNCNEAILGPAPLQDCRYNIAGIQPRVASAGPVQSISFMASAQSPMGEADRFMVQHAGAQVTWTGVLGGDGKFIVLVSP